MATYHALLSQGKDLGDAVHWEWRCLHDDLGMRKEPWEWLRTMQGSVHDLLAEHSVPQTQFCRSAGVQKAEGQHAEHTVGSRCMLHLLCKIALMKQPKPKTRRAAWDIASAIVEKGAAMCSEPAFCRVVLPVRDERGGDARVVPIVIEPTGVLQGMTAVFEAMPSLQRYWDTHFGKQLSAGLGSGRVVATSSSCPGLRDLLMLVQSISARGAAYCRLW